MSGYLELEDGAFIGVRDGLVLGRVSACDVVVKDAKASRRHARLIVEGGVVEIEDMNSSNGTLLNGKPVERRMMRDGDEVRIGKTVIVYREGPTPGSSASRSSSSSSGGGGIFDDDDDLFADSSSSSTLADSARPTPPPAPEPEPELIQPRSKAKPPVPEPEPESAPASDDPFGDDDLLGGDDLSSSDPEPAQAAPSNVVEFEDEVVEVQQEAPAPKAPEPVRRPAEPVVEVRKAEPSAPQRGAGATRSAADDVVGTSGRILQYSKKSSGKNPLGDDLGQMSGGMRLLVVLGGLAIGGGIIYGVMIAMQ